ncbi:MAG TPA: LemA family protein [Chitinophagaceae bacterium]|nr:LemA family protein [Chitinophagaceae bacterium]
MKTRKLILLNVLFVLLIGGMSSCTYNDLVSKETEVEEQWSNVENQYQRRSDLIPNLVNTVKGAANFEKSTLTDVIKARASATKITVDPSKLDPKAIQKFQASQGQLSQALGRLMMVSERYPKLQATESFKGLQAQLEGTENRIAVARRDFNTSVSNYNKAIRKFPGVIYASLFGFEKKGFFEAEDGAKEAPTVDFGSDSSE